MTTTPSRNNDRLMAGAGEADISPALGIQLAGSIGRHRPTQEIREPIYTRALVLESRNTRVCILTLDLLAVSNEWAARIREQVADKLGVTPSEIILHCEQNHAAPEIGHCFFNTDDDHLMPGGDLNWLGGGDDRYNQPCVESIIKAVDCAIKNVRPVTLSVARGVDGRVAWNRRFVMRDGSSRWHPPKCSPDILYCEGPMDPEVGVMVLTDDDGNNVGAWLHHTCHPVHAYPKLYVIGGWPGAWVEQMRTPLGDGCIPMVINGCCGNIHHTQHLSPGPAKDHQWMASKLTETACDAMDRLERQESSILGIERAVLRLPTRTPEPERVEAAKKMLAAHPDPLWIDKENGVVDMDWVLNTSLINFLETYSDDPHFDYEIQALRVADMALVSVMGEPFVEGQLKVKLRSPAPYTFVAHFCNGYAGYIPIDQAFETGTGPGGTPDLRPGNGSRFAPGALDKIADAAIELLNRLF